MPEYPSSDSSDLSDAQTMDAVALQRANRVQEAIVAYKAALDCNPDNAYALSNYGGLLCSLGEFQTAKTLLARAVSIKPDMPDAWSNFANVLFEMQDYSGAIEAYKNCLTLQPQHPLALSNLGVALDCQGRHALALNFHKAAIQLEPDNGQSRTNYALSLLAQGDYVEGFKAYEWRWNSNILGKHNLQGPVWDGKPFVGKTLLVHTEGGFGDMLHFVRFVPYAAERGGTVIVKVRKELLTLLQRSFPEQLFITVDDSAPPHDLECSVGSLPYLLGTTLDTIPQADGYLVPDPDKVAMWKNRLDKDLFFMSTAPTLRIGLVWAGSPHREVRYVEFVDQRRSINLQSMAPLAKVPNVLFYSLQVGEKGIQAKTPPAGMKLVNHTNLLHDFDDTAALIANLDMVISVDTSVVHLAAGLGKPVWMLSRFDQCWRWLSGRTDTPWYDHLRIYQQSQPLDWDTPINKMLSDLVLLEKQTEKIKKQEII
ncbi:tetratricopeptide repeat-containing glycosyltransferase family protein [Acetobacter sp. LMG 32666]|uniref:tetratricopeptide repeat-containing glycosyltransferase family protein n=1 Tax=Acetobacter sp. LMG 32666 TaxID=2959295 RepID=UPI0030C84A4F